MVEVPIPAKDKIHKQWCLFDQNQSQLSARDSTKEPQLTAQDSNNDEADLIFSGRNARNLSFDDGIEKDEIVLSEVFNQRERRRERTFSTFELNSRDD